MGAVSGGFSADQGIVEINGAPRRDDAASMGDGIGAVGIQVEQTYQTLKNLEGSEGSPFDGVALEYVNPGMVGTRFRRCRVGRRCCDPGRCDADTPTHNSSTVYHAFRGSGVTVINGESYEWEQGDCFVVPLWSWHSHQNRSKNEEAILFSMNDQPMLEALKLYREEPGEGPSES